MAAQALAHNCGEVAFACRIEGRTVEMDLAVQVDDGCGEPFVIELARYGERLPALPAGDLRERLRVFVDLPHPELAQ